MADAPARPEIGIRCTLCGCQHLKTTHTRRLPGSRVRRYKECRHCGRRMMTIEMLPRDAGPAGG